MVARRDPILLVKTKPILLKHVCGMHMQGLADLGFEVVSTGGSAATLEKAGVPVQRVEQLTGFPEMLDGIALAFPCVLQALAVSQTTAQPSDRT